METINDLKKDIVIIGAGPAGATFAEKIAGLGFDVLLVDGQTEKNRKPCGGLLSPDAQILFAKEDMTLPKDVLADPQIFYVKTIDIENGLERNYSRNYLNMDRAGFDRFLLDKIPNDIDVFCGRCSGIKKNNDPVSDNTDFEYKVFLTENSGKKIAVDTKIVVGADGASSIVRKNFYPEIKQYVAIQEWYERQENENMYYACIFDEKTSESCSWIIRKEDNIIFGGCFDIKDGKEMFEKQKKRLLEKTSLKLENKTKREACLVNVPEKMKDFITGKDNVYLIGESAGFISASSFEGISNAIKSARNLAECLTKISPENLSENKEDISKSYAKLCKPLKRKLYIKIWKKKLLFTPFTRKFIMKTGFFDIGIKQAEM